MSKESIILISLTIWLSLIGDDHRCVGLRSRQDRSIFMKRPMCPKRIVKGLRGSFVSRNISLDKGSSKPRNLFSQLRLGAIGSEE